MTVVTPGVLGNAGASGSGGSTSLATGVGVGVSSVATAVASGWGVDSTVGAGVEVSRDSALGGSGDATSLARSSSEGGGVGIDEVAGVLGVPQAEARDMSPATRTTRSLGRARSPETEVKVRARSCAPR
jgi:hypothetical protein